MELVASLAIGIVFGAGIWLLLRPRSFQVLTGLMLMSYAVNLFIFIMGRVWLDEPPLTPAGRMPDPRVLADPLPQALVLTAIVIGFALTVVFAAFVLRAWRTERTVDGRAVDAAERLGLPRQEDDA